MSQFTGYIQGLKFSPVNGSRAVASYDTGVIQLLTLTPQAIYSEYTLYCQNISYNIDISPSGTQAAGAGYAQLILFKIAHANISQVAFQLIDSGDCYGATFVNESIVLITCGSTNQGSQFYPYYVGSGIYQFSIMQTTIILQTCMSLAQTDYGGITFLTGSNTTGIYVGGSNLYNFTYTYNGSSSNMSSDLLFWFDYAYGATFSADNSRLILVGDWSITLYKNVYIANCASYNSQGTCLSCNNGYYSPQLNCSYTCNRTCQTCSNSISCDTCELSSPSRIPSQFCACQSTTFDDGINSQCQSCSQLCATCTKSSQCLTCIGSVSANSSRILPDCSCPSTFYYDAYPEFAECQSNMSQQSTNGQQSGTGQTANGQQSGTGQTTNGQQSGTGQTTNGQQSGTGQTTNGQQNGNGQTFYGQQSGNGQTSNSIPAWGIALIVIGCLIVLILAGVYCYKKYRIHIQQRPADFAGEQRQYQMQQQQEQNRQQQQQQNLTQLQEISIESQQSEQNQLQQIQLQPVQQIELQQLQQIQLQQFQQQLQQLQQIQLQQFQQQLQQLQQTQLQQFQQQQQQQQQYMCQRCYLLAGVWETSVCGHYKFCDVCKGNQVNIQCDRCPLSTPLRQFIRLQQ